MSARPLLYTILYFLSADRPCPRHRLFTSRSLGGAASSRAGSPIRSGGSGLRGDNESVLHGVTLLARRKAGRVLGSKHRKMTATHEEMAAMEAATRKLSTAKKSKAFEGPTFRAVAVVTPGIREQRAGSPIRSRP